MPSVSFAGVEDQKDFTPAPAGVYVLKFTDYKEKEVQSGDNKGAEMYALTFEIVSEDEDVNGKKVFDNQVYVKKAMFRVKAFLKAQGYEIDDSDGAEELNFEYSELLGNQLYARVTVQPESKDKVTGRVYPAKNQIAKFLIQGDHDEEIAEVVE